MIVTLHRDTLLSLAGQADYPEELRKRCRLRATALLGLKLAFAVMLSQNEFIAANVGRTGLLLCGCHSYAEASSCIGFACVPPKASRGQRVPCDLPVSVGPCGVRWMSTSGVWEESMSCGLLEVLRLHTSRAGASSSWS